MEQKIFKKLGCSKSGVFDESYNETAEDVKGYIKALKFRFLRVNDFDVDDDGEDYDDEEIDDEEEGEESEYFYEYLAEETDESKQIQDIVDEFFDEQEEFESYEGVISLCKETIDENLESIDKINEDIARETKKSPLIYLFPIIVFLAGIIVMFKNFGIGFSLVFTSLNIFLAMMSYRLVVNYDTEMIYLDEKKVNLKAVESISKAIEVCKKRMIEILMNRKKLKELVK